MSIRLGCRGLALSIHERASSSDCSMPTVMMVKFSSASSSYSDCQTGRS